MSSREPAHEGSRNDELRDLCLLDCLDLADASRNLNRAIKVGDLKSESFWLSLVSLHSNGILRMCIEFEIRRIKAMREELKKSGQIEPNAEVKKESTNERTRMNLYEEYEFNCRSLYRTLVNMGDFNDAKEEKMFANAKRDWEDLVKVREKLKKKTSTGEGTRNRNVKNTA